jgi:mRNA-degrading endonuclease YafQ of YafQ-DinJ toxin-antitoxin module
MRNASAGGYLTPDPAKVFALDRDESALRLVLLGSHSDLLAK